MVQRIARKSIPFASPSGRSRPRRRQAVCPFINDLETGFGGPRSACHTVYRRGSDFVVFAPAPRRNPAKRETDNEMTKDELAEALRSQLAEKCRRGDLDASLPAGRESFLENLRNIPQDNLIGGFLKCSICGRLTMPIDRATQLATHLNTVEDWIKGLAIWRERFGGCEHGAGEASGFGG
jgi:hypothetical protein